MSDVEITYPQGRESIVRRLHDALLEAGYDVGSREVSESGAAPAGADVSAVLILWDRSTMAHPGLRAVASPARARDRAIDVSVDGITPIDLEDDRRLIQLSGWRGDPHHPGWRKILARLDQLCHARREPVAMRAAPAAQPAGRRRDDAGPASPRATRFVFASAAGVLLLIVVIAALLISGRDRAASPPSQAPAVAESPPAAAPQASAPPAAQAGGASGQAAQPTGAAIAAVSAPQETTAPATTGQAAVPPAVETAPIANQAGQVPTPHGARRRVRSATSREGHRPLVRYTRYSGTMRLFCARSGRGTPECRVFNQATRR